MVILNPVEKNFKIIKESMLFDEKWYVSQYLKSNENINPIRHYITEGVKRNLNPSSFIFYMVGKKEDCLILLLI